MNPSIPPTNKVPPRSGDFVRLLVGGTPHPAVVIRVDSDVERALVIYGTGTAGRSFEHRIVEPERREGKALKLTKPTYFYVTSLRLAKFDLLTTTGCRCPPGLFIDLNELANKGLKDLTSAQLLQGLPEVLASNL